jgi:hypothetical protein
MSLHEHLRSLPSISPQQPLHAFKRLKKLGVRVLLTQPVPTEETKWKIAFEPPPEIQIVGSWPNQLTVIGRAERAFYVDLAVGMPSVSPCCCMQMYLLLHDIPIRYSSKKKTTWTLDSSIRDHISWQPLRLP